MCVRQRKRGSYLPNREGPGGLTKKGRGWGESSLAGQDAGSGWRADCLLHLGFPEEKAFADELVDIWREHRWRVGNSIAVTAKLYAEVCVGRKVPACD